MEKKFHIAETRKRCKRQSNYLNCARQLAHDRSRATKESEEFFKVRMRGSKYNNESARSRFRIGGTSARPSSDVLGHY
jgi:hypothetical protein